MLRKCSTLFLFLALTSSGIISSCGRSESNVDSASAGAEDAASVPHITIKGQISAGTQSSTGASPDISLPKNQTDANSDPFLITLKDFNTVKQLVAPATAAADGSYSIDVPLSALGGAGATADIYLEALNSRQTLLTAFRAATAADGQSINKDVTAQTTAALAMAGSALNDDAINIAGSSFQPGKDAMPQDVLSQKDPIIYMDTYARMLQTKTESGFGNLAKTIEIIVTKAATLGTGTDILAVINKYIKGDSIDGKYSDIYKEAAIDLDTAKTFAQQFKAVKTFVTQTLAQKDSTINKFMRVQGDEATTRMAQTLASFSDATALSSTSSLDFFRGVIAQAQTANDFSVFKDAFSNPTAVGYFLSVASSKGGWSISTPAVVSFFIKSAPTIFKVNNGELVQGGANDIYNFLEAAAQQVSPENRQNADVFLDIIEKAPFVGSRFLELRLKGTAVTEATFNFQGFVTRIKTASTFDNGINLADFFTATPAKTASVSSTGATVSLAIPISEKYPAPDAKGVATTVVYAVFSKDVDPATVTTSTFIVKGADGAAVAGSVAYNAFLRRAAFTPSSPFALSTAYTVVLTTGLKSKGGGNLESQVTWSFTTPTALIITETSPANQGLCPIRGIISATYSNPLSSDTLANLAVTLKCNSINVSGTTTVTPGNKIVQFAPAAALTAGQSCQMTFPAVKDFVGNSLAATSVTCTVTDDTDGPTAVTALTATPNGGACNLSFNQPTDNVTTSTNIACYIFSSATAGGEDLNQASPFKIFRMDTTATSTSTSTWQGYNTARYYVIRCKDAVANWGAASGEVSCQTTIGPPSLNVEASTDKSCSADLNWSAMSGAIGYKLYADTSSNFTPGSGNLISGNATSPYKQSGLTCDTTYYFKAVSFNAKGDSVASGYSSFTPTLNYTKTEIAGSSGKANHPSMVLDSNSKVHMSSVNADGDLMYATNTSGSLQQVTIYQNSTGRVRENAITRDSSNNLYISFYDDKYTNKSTWVDDSQDYIKVAKCAAGLDCTTTSNWTFTTVRTMSTSINSSCGRGLNNIAVENGGKIHIVFVDLSSNENSCSLAALYETTCSTACTTASNWSAPVQIDTLGTNGANARLSLVLDSADKPRVAYVVSGGSYPYYTSELRTAKYTTAWQAPESVQSVTSSIYYGLAFPSLALDASGNSMISYGYSNYPNFALRLATNATGAWVITDIDSSSSRYFDYGQFSSMAIDSGNKIHIAYGTSYGSEVRYATNKSGAWVLSTLDSYSNYSSVNTNWYINIVLDSSSNPHFGYFKYGSNSLWYTKQLPY